jgi:hypothetical protein
MLSFLGFFSHFPVNAFFLFPQSEIEKPTHAALGPQVLKHPERGDGIEGILFYFTLGLLWHLICVFLFLGFFLFSDTSHVGFSFFNL